MIPITANLASADSIIDSPSSLSLGPTGNGNTNEFIIDAPIATTNGASCTMAALHIPVLICRFYVKNKYKILETQILQNTTNSDTVRLEEAFWFYKQNLLIKIKKRVAKNTEK